MSAFTLAISKILLLRTSINGQKKYFKKLYIGVKYIEIYKNNYFILISTHLPQINVFNLPSRNKARNFCKNKK